ncbi:MAG: metallophosphoesterase [Actinomycetota bacterium]|nr:metallophosphoesterase [Actinomycetota bacterium]
MRVSETIVRIAHISDTHLGYSRYAKLCPRTSRNQREVDVQEAYEKAVDAILERDVDLVIHSGDVFDSVRPATHVIIGFLKQTARITLHANIPYLITAGNHETPRLRATTAALEYANLVNAYSVHEFDIDYWQDEIEGATVGVTLVPHGAVSTAGAVTPERDADINILVTHGLVPNLEARQHEMGEANLHSGMLEGAFDYIALGHYHDFHEHKPNSYYAGATERFGFGEVESTPGFAMVEFGSDGVSVEHVPIQTRPMLDLPFIRAREMDSAQLTEEIRRRTSEADLDGAIVRLRAYDVRRGVSSGIDRELLRDLQRRCLNFSLEIHPEERPDPESGNGPASAVFGPLEEEFAAFVKARKESGELEKGFAEEFLEKGRGYLARAASEELGSPGGGAG